ALMIRGSWTGGSEAFSKFHASAKAIINQNANAIKNCRTFIFVSRAKVVEEYAPADRRDRTPGTERSGGYSQSKRTQFLSPPRPHLQGGITWSKVGSPPCCGTTITTWNNRERTCLSILREKMNSSSDPSADGVTLNRSAAVSCGASG